MGDGERETDMDWGRERQRETEREMAKGVRPQMERRAREGKG